MGALSSAEHMALILAGGGLKALLIAVYSRQWGVEFTANFNRNSTWGDVNDAFRFWARMLRQMLERDGLEAVASDS